MSLKRRVVCMPSNQVQQQSNKKWVPLIEYSNRYHISISTLRRRIKLESIPFKLEGGKYYILDDEGAAVEEPSLQTNKRAATPQSEQEMPKFEASSSSGRDETILSAANRLLDELKRAYTAILQEKDEQQKILREEIADLKTLVRVLEDENNRLQNLVGEVSYRG